MKKLNMELEALEVRATPASDIYEDAIDLGVLQPGSGYAQQTYGLKQGGDISFAALQSQDQVLIADTLFHDCIANGPLGHTWFVVTGGTCASDPIGVYDTLMECAKGHVFANMNFIGVAGGEALDSDNPGAEC